MNDDIDVRVFVAEGSRLPKNKKFIKAAKQIGEYLGKRKYVYLQGCNEYGLMGATYNEFIKYNDKARLVDLNVVYFDNYHEDMVGDRIKCSNLNNRLQTFADNTDILVVLPGANGTVHEFTTFFEINRMYPNAYEIILLNMDHFYDKLIEFYDVMAEQDLCDGNEFREQVRVVTTVEEVIDLIKNYKRRPAVERLVLKKRDVYIEGDYKD